MNVLIKKLHENAREPTYATNGSGCFDLYSVSSGYVPPNFNLVFTTGLAIQIPKNHVMLIFSRSGQGFGHDVRLANCVGVIDSDYRGEVKVKLSNDSNHKGFTVAVGDRIAQGIIIPYKKIHFHFTEELNNTERGEGGFGSTN